MISKQAVIQIQNNKVSLVLLETKEQVYYNIIDVFYDTLPLVEDIEENEIIKPVTIKELLKILKMYRRICDNNAITEISMFTGNFFSKAKNIKSIAKKFITHAAFRLQF